MKLALEALLAAGEAKAGLEAGSAPRAATWVGNLRRLVESAAAEGGFHAESEAAYAEQLAGFVRDRLVAEQWLAREPSIARRPLAVRFLVAGMGRSGTTFLQRLLACDPEVSFLPTWQAMNPVPALDAMPCARADDPRRRRTVAFLDDLRAKHPEAFRIHPLEADAPEEEVFLLQPSFASMLFVIPTPVPRYSSWLNTTDHSEAYRFALDLIRINAWFEGTPAGRPRVMKSPQFLLDLEVVQRVVPDALIVQTHRDPVDLVGSYCSTYADSRRRTQVRFDPIALGQERLAQLHVMSERAIAARERGDASRFADVHYARLVVEPLAVVASLYERAGLVLSRAARAAMEAWLAHNPQHKAGPHRYSLADYGLDRAQVEARFTRYLERFAVAREAGSA